MLETRKCLSKYNTHKNPPYCYYSMIAINPNSYLGSIPKFLCFLSKLASPELNWSVIHQIRKEDRALFSVQNPLKR